jgi:hypothetical protein
MASASTFESFIKFIQINYQRYLTRVNLKRARFCHFLHLFQTANLRYFHFLHSHKSYATQLENWPLSRSISEISLLAASGYNNLEQYLPCASAPLLLHVFCHTGGRHIKTRARRARRRCNYAIGARREMFSIERVSQCIA